MKTSKANTHGRVVAETLLIDLLDKGLERGFFGTLMLKLEIQDGTIQGLYTTVDRIHKTNRD